jgi:regulatory protein
MISRSSASDPLSAAIDAALRLLSIRARSRRELKLAMARRGLGESVQDAALSRLEELGYVDDARFARDRASALLRNGKLGPRAVLQRLRGHGLSEEQAKQALADSERALSFDPLEAARLVLHKRGLAGRALEPKEKSKAVRLLHARGFADGTIEQLLGVSELDLGPEDG